MESDSVFDEQMCRIQFITGAHTQLALADFLGIRQSAVSDAKRRGKIPAEWLVILMRIKKVFPEWILTGNGPCFTSIPSKSYETGVEATERREDEEALRRLSSRALADELVRRIAVSQSDSFLHSAKE